MEKQLLAVGVRVRILLPLMDDIKQEGVIYRHCPLRLWPWHVRPDNWPGGDLGGGIAFDATEIKPLSEVVYAGE